MSFYGDIKRINSSPYVFDKVYPNRKAMDDHINDDNIYIGRYVLVKYTCKYNENNLEYFNKYSNVNYTEVTSDVNNTNYLPNIYYINQSGKYILDTKDSYTQGRRYYTAKYILNLNYVENINTDLKQYKDTYDATVWQKVFTHANLNGNASYKYILVAELNAEVPDLNLKLISPKNGVIINDNWAETWNEPSFLPAFSSVDSYTLEMPNILHLDVNNLDENFYAKDLTNPAVKYRMVKNNLTGQITSTSATTTLNSNQVFLNPELMMSDEYNAIGWNNLRYDKALNEYKIIPNDSEHIGPIDGKQLNMRLYAFGLMLSDLYDVLYGVPKLGAGKRPFYTQELDDILSNYDKGLVGVLTSIATEAHGDASQDCYGRTIAPGMHYYFNVKWTDAFENPDNFIENIPRVVGSLNERTNDRAHYNYDFISCDYAQNN